MRVRAERDEKDIGGRDSNVQVKGRCPSFFCIAVVPTLASPRLADGGRLRKGAPFENRWFNVAALVCKAKQDQSLHPASPRTRPTRDSGRRSNRVDSGVALERSIEQSRVIETELLRLPQVGQNDGVGDTDADVASLERPVGGPLETELVPDGIESSDECGLLGGGVEGRGRDAEALGANGDGRVVWRVGISAGYERKNPGRTDALNVELVLLEEKITSGLGENCAANELVD